MESILVFPVLSFLFPYFVRTDFGETIFLHEVHFKTYFFIIEMVFFKVKILAKVRDIMG